MNLEEFKKKVEENLLKITKNEKTTQVIMKKYEEDFPQILQENWSVEGITPALLMNLY